MMEPWDFPPEYVDAVRAARSAEDVMRLFAESSEHGDLFAYERAQSVVRREDAMAKYVEMEEGSATWAEVSRDFLFGRNDLPWALYQAWSMNLLKGDAELAEAVEESWVGAEWPEQYMDTDIWLDIFYEVGFLEEDKISDRPTEPMTLYRGAAESRWNGMAWTDDRAKAAWFARRFQHMTDSEPVKLFRTSVEPEALLAHFTSRGENEWVVDPNELFPENVDVLEIDAADAVQ